MPLHKPQLNGPDYWMEWNRKLNGTLAIANLWKVLTGERSPLAETYKSFAIWEDNQRSLNDVLLLSCGPSALSIIQEEKDASATKKYKLLKAEYEGQTLITFSTLHRKISRCKISNHKSLQEYGEEVKMARNKLVGPGEPLPEMFVSCSFLDGLDLSYNAWKDMYFLSYSKTIKDVDGKMIQPTVKENFMLLINWETGQISGAASSKSQPRAFKAGQGSKNNEFNNRQRKSRCAI